MDKKRKNWEREKISCEEWGILLIFPLLTFLIVGIGSLVLFG